MEIIIFFGVMFLVLGVTILPIILTTRDERQRDNNLRERAEQLERNYTATGNELDRAKKQVEDAGTIIADSRKQVSGITDITKDNERLVGTAKGILDTIRKRNDGSDSGKK